MKAAIDNKTGIKTLADALKFYGVPSDVVERVIDTLRFQGGDEALDLLERLGYKISATVIKDKIRFRIMKTKRSQI